MKSIIFREFVHLKISIFVYKRLQVRANLKFVDGVVVFFRYRKIMTTPVAFLVFDLNHVFGDVFGDVGGDFDSIRIDEFYIRKAKSPIRHSENVATVLLDFGFFQRKTVDVFEYCVKMNCAVFVAFWYNDVF